MSTENPQTCPTPYRVRGLDPVPEHDAVRDGNDVAFPLEAARMPDRCVLCNRPAEAYRVLHDVENLPPIEVPLCVRHRRRKAWGRTVAGCGFASASAAFVMPFFTNSMWGVAIPCVVSLALILTGGWLRTAADPRAIRDGFVLVRAGKAFLASIPSRTEAHGGQRQR